MDTLKNWEKTTLIKIFSIVFFLVILCVGVFILLMNVLYKPDKESLNIVNEASVMLYNSEITNQYKQQGIEKLDDQKLYVFEFTLKNGNKATFAFAKDLKDTYSLYYKNDNGQLILVIFNSTDKERDNDASWPEAWSE